MESDSRRRAGPGAFADPLPDSRHMALEMTEERVLTAAQRLHDGDWCYSGRQLYYAVCADVETPPTRVASGEVGLGVLLILIGALTGQRVVLVALGIVGLLLLIVGAVTRVQERRPLPLARLLAISYADFERRFLVEPQHYPGLVTSSTPSTPTGATTLVVCDRPETAAVIEANRTHLHDIAVALPGQLVQDLGGNRLVTLHDCDPAGCALTADLRERGAEVVDAGINPAELTGRRLQLLEGAPARLPRDLSGHLEDAELDWLRSGRRLECATQTPEQLAQRVQAAVSSLGVG
jgi:hypothetical protein